MTLETTRRRFLVGPDPCGPEGWATAMRRISVRSSFVSSPPGLLTDSTTAKAADRARRDHRAGDARRIEHRAAEVLRSEEHTSELQSLMRISYAVFCLKKKNTKTTMRKEHTIR